MCIVLVGMRQKATIFFRNPFVQLFFFILLLLGGRSIWYLHYSPPEHPYAVRGIIDMRGWDFEQSPIIPLNGEWAFYPDQFVAFAGLQAGIPSPSRYIQSPGDWREAWDSTSKADSYGYGTYHLRILVDGTASQPYGFAFDNVQTSSRVEINGDQVALFGKPSDQRHNYEPNVRSYTASYPSKGVHEIDLLVHVANFDNPTAGGLKSAVKFGTQAAIERERTISINLQLVTFVIFLLHAVYALIMYVINPRQKILLIAFLLFTCAGISVVSTSDRLLLQLLPLTYAVRVKVSLLSYVYVPFCILVMSLKLVGSIRQLFLFRLYAAALVLYTFFLILAPIRAVYVGFHVFGALYLLPFAIILMLFIKKVRQDGRDVLLLMAATSVVFSVIGGVFQGGVITEFYPLDMIVALISFSTYWFKNYFRNAEENIRLNERLKQNDKLKDEFLAHTAHELRTPLHGMINLAQTVLGEEGQTIRPQNSANMELLVRVGHRMSQLINDLLDMSRLQEKRIVLRPERLKLQSIAPGVFTMLAYLAEAKELRMRINVQDTFPSILADEKRLVQILYNLLHNAIKFTDSGEIIVSAEVNGSMACIHVSDSGIGMDDETQARIFHSYEQGDQRFGGIGLGLSICKQLTELHGGRLSVWSEPGRGSIFTFTVPLATPESDTLLEAAISREEIEADKGAPSAGTSQRISTLWSDVKWQPPEASLPSWNDKPNILVVDDDPMNLKVLSSIFPAEQYRIIPALSGKEALAKLGTTSWDLAIIDVMMPHMSGYELTKEIRKQYTVYELPVVLLTARSQPEDIYAGLTSGANDYVTKPVDALELRYRIQSLITLKRSIHERLRMEAAYLQAQIHPHFLLNALNSIMALSDIDTDRMRRLGGKFAAYLQISYDFLNTGELVELAHELELVDAYLYIEKERFGDRLSVLWEIEADIKLRIPPLSIQPLVENAVKHGLLSRNIGGTLYVRVTHNEHFTLIEVEDNGKGMEQEKVNELLNALPKGKGGIGLSNTNRRLIQMFGHGLLIVSHPGKGTTVSFKIPNTLS